MFIQKPKMNCKIYQAGSGIEFARFNTDPAFHIRKFEKKNPPGFAKREVV
jgi:hypothetical protein